jgi:RsiW-degrading membrane proteinase PrsW (M82 family)
VGLVTLWSIAILLVVVGVLQRSSPDPLQGRGVPFILMGSASGFLGLLLIPSAGLASLRLIGRRVGRFSSPGWLRPTLFIFLLPLVLLAGRWVSTQEEIAWLVLPPFHILAIGIPILWLTSLTVRGLPVGSDQRLWGMLSSGSVLSPFLILLLEVAVVLGGLVIWVALLSGNPDAMSEISLLTSRLDQARNSPELLLHILQPYLTNEHVIFGAFAFGAVIVPLIEEAFKPLAVWFLAGSRPMPSAGFVAGAICGAGYALAESLLLSSNGGTEWLSLVLARIGTGVVHILASGLTGWALALAWRKHRREGMQGYLGLGIAYLGAVGLHGLWNGLTLLIVAAGISQSMGQTGPEWLQMVDQFVPYALVGLTIAGLVAMLWINGRLRRQLDLEKGIV